MVSSCTPVEGEAAYYKAAVTPIATIGEGSLVSSCLSLKVAVNPLKKMFTRNPSIVCIVSAVDLIYRFKIKRWLAP